MSTRHVLPALVAGALALGVVTAAPAFAAAPTITAVAPSSGTIGTSVTVTGTGFAAGATVRFGGVAAVRPVVTGATRITAVVPADATTGPVTVTTAGGTATSATPFTVMPGATGSAATTTPGGSFTLHAVGFAAFEAVDLYFDTTDVGLASTGSGGAADPAVVVPVSAVPGTHTWTLVGRRSGTAVQVAVAVHTNWPQFGLDSTHRGQLTTENVLDAQHVAGLQETWRTQQNQYTPDDPAVVAGVVYQAAGNDVYAYSLATGAVRWSHQLGDAAAGSVVVNGSNLVVATYSGTVLALRLADGAPVWSTTAPGANFNDNGAVGGGLYVLTSNQHQVLAVNVVTGALVWTTTVDDLVRTTAAISGGRVFVGTIGGHEYGLDLATGATLWSYATGNEILGSATVANGLVYFGSLDDTFYAVRASTGALVWSHLADNQVSSTPAVAGGVVYFGDRTEHAYALDAATGAMRWTTPVDDSLLGRVTVADGVVWFAGQASTIALWASDGEQLWEVKAGNGNGGAVIADGTLLVSDSIDECLIHYALPVGLTPRAPAAPDPRTLQRSDHVPVV